MSERGRIRYTCSVCGNRCRGQLTQHLFSTTYKGLRVMQWTHHELCPPCTLALRDFLKGGASLRVK